MITSKQILTDIVGFINGVEFPVNDTPTTLAALVNGGVYRAGLRPRDSKAEDVVVAFLTGKPYEIQTGYVNISIYVPDICPYGNGVYVENMERTDELEAALAGWVEALNAGVTTGYLFDGEDTINTVEDAEIHQHFVYIRLHYKYYNN